MIDSITRNGSEQKEKNIYLFFFWVVGLAKVVEKIDQNLLVSFPLF